MQDESGYFYYRKYPLITNKTPTLHWGQATMFAALALLERHLSKQTNASVNPQTRWNSSQIKSEDGASGIHPLHAR